MHCVDMSQKQGDATQLKAKSTVTRHIIKSNGFVKKSDSNVPVYNHSRLRRSGRTCYFGPQPKSGALGTVDDNLIDLCDEED